MSIEAHRWLMTAANAPLERARFDAEPGAGEVVGRHRRLRRLPHRPRLFLRRRADQPAAAAGARARDQRPVVAAGAGAEPAGSARRSSCPPSSRAASATCAGAACAHDLPPNQKMPGNDIQGGFASHIVVPARGLCEVDEARLARAGLDARRRVDRRRRAHHAVPGRAARRRRARQPRRRRRRRRRRRLLRADRPGVRRARSWPSTSTTTSSPRSPRHGAALTLNSRALDGKAIKAAIGAFAKQNGLRATEWFIFECSGTAAGQLTAYGLLVHGATLCRWSASRWTRSRSACPT